VELEGGFVLPAGMDVEEPGIADRAEGVDGEAAWLFRGGADRVVDRRCDRGLLPLAGVEAVEDAEPYSASKSRYSAPSACGRRPAKGWRGLAYYALSQVRLICSVR
jgi:hypothetical protein